MKHLLLIRHAQAVTDNHGFRDFDRPLTASGAEEANEAFGALASEYQTPELILFSPARRTEQTAQIVAAAFGYPPENMIADRRIYLAAASDLLTIVHETADDVSRLVIVGHNPGVPNFVKLLAPREPFTHFPTATACALSFEASSWSAVAIGTPAVRFHLPT